MGNSGSIQTIIGMRGDARLRMNASRNLLIECTVISSESKMADEPKTTASEWDAESWGFACEPGVGLTIADDLPSLSRGERWLCWREVLALHEWLGRKIGEAGFPNRLKPIDAG